MAEVQNASRIDNPSPFKSGKKFAFPVTTPVFGVHEYYADVKLSKRIFTKLRKKITQYVTVFLGAYTHPNFLLAVKNGTVEKRIDAILIALVGYSPSYIIEGYWRGGRYYKI